MMDSFADTKGEAQTYSVVLSKDLPLSTHS